MLYLEDYLEIIEHLPQEFKDRFTQMRELDLSVSNATDRLGEEVRNFFVTAKRQKTPEREAEYQSICKKYEATLEDADEKFNQATFIHNLVEKYLRKLEQELHKFKMELEADNAGITEVLEKRSLEQDGIDKERPRDSCNKDGRYVNYMKTERKAERKSSHEKQVASVSPANTLPSSAAISYSLGNMGIGGSAIAAAASQAIAATQQLQQGRRTASLKASYEAVNSGLHSTELSIGPELLANAELHQAAQQALAATSSAAAGEQKRNKRKSQHTQHHDAVSSSHEDVQDPLILDSTESINWPYDPTEPRYCFCNQVSYGSMVACDNPSCPYEWFHYDCVGVTQTPKGNWYCRECVSSFKRRGRKSKHERKFNDGF